MKDYFVIIHYRESEWIDDILCFHVPEYVSYKGLIKELNKRRVVDPIDDDCDLVDHMEDAAGEVAAMFGGTWSYPAVSAAAATVDFEYGDEEE